jgi:hypothetical protein
MCSADEARESGEEGCIGRGWGVSKMQALSMHPVYCYSPFDDEEGRRALYNGSLSRFSLRQLSRVLSICGGAIEEGQ